MTLEAMKQSSTASSWPDEHLHDDAGKPVPFHLGQKLTWDSKSRLTAMTAGSQGGKTSWGPWWLRREMDLRGGGDYLAVTSTYDLFKLKMLPSMLLVYEDILKIGRYWTGDKVIEIRDPATGEFMAKRSADRMYARIILRSADSLSGLESSSSKGAWLDECGMDKFTYSAYKAIRRRLTLNTGRILMTTTLYNLGWLVSHIIDPVTGSADFEKTYRQGKAQIDIMSSTKHNTSVIQFDSIINPQFPYEEFEEQRGLLSEEEFDMFFRGRKSTRRLLIYNVFDPQKHVCDPFPIPDEWNRYIGVDFGSTHMAAVFFAEEPETKILYAYREYMEPDKTISNHVRDIISSEGTIRRAAGGARNEDQWRREFTRHGLFIEEPPISDVDLGINRVYAQIKTDKIMVFANLHGILDEMGRYRRKRDAFGAVQDEIEDKSSFHFLDATRYIISTIRPGVSLRAKVINLGEVNSIW